MALSLLRASRRLSLLPPSRALSGHHFFLEFADLFSADKPHTALAIRTFELVHDVSGLPWWATILAGGVFLRTATCLPFHVLSEINIARVINARPKLLASHKALVEKAAEMRGEKDARVKLKAMQRKGREAVYQSENCHPLYSMVCQLLQFPVWLTASFGVRHLCGIGFSGLPPAPGIETGGFAWMTDLTVPDPYFILPCLVFGLNVANHELNNLTKTSQTMQSKGMVTFRRVVSTTLSGGVCLLACFLPQAMVLYWFVSSLHLLCLRIVFLYPGVKRFFRVPSTPLDLDRPLRTMWENAKNYSLLRRLQRAGDVERKGKDAGRR